MAECAEKVAKTSDNADSVGGKVKEETENRVKLCGPCFEEGNEVPATKFCVDCDDHLCETCVQYHRKVKLIKNHELIDISAVVQCSKKKERKADVFNCTNHQEELTHYCEKHGKLCCLKCVRGIHTMCGDSVCKVDEAAEKIEENRIFKEFVDKLHHLVVEAQENEKRATDKIKTGMEQFQRQIESARKVADEEVGRIKTIASSMVSITGELSKWKNLVENAKKAKDYGKLFIAMKLATEQLEFHDESIHALERNNKWSLKLTYDISIEIPSPILLKKVMMNETCNIRDICALGEHIAVVDSLNGGKIILMKVSHSATYSENTTGGFPWEVTANSSGQMYACLKRKSTIRKYLHPLTDINKFIEIKTDTQAFCIRCYRDVVRIQGRNSYSLQEMDASGITRIKHKEGVLSSIASVDIHSAIDDKTGSMFLIGKEPFGLRVVTKEGEVNTIALSKPIEDPGGIVLESDGTFLVSSESGKSIKRVTVEGSVEDFITGLDFEPHGLGFDKQRRLLYVGGIGSHVILMYYI
ncbi:uncharacterized protein LOC128243958 [Mya arenaria]|uniref:uncharacterized protein LOC128243958 n=1 Tax=Mya arenaria TaxID=6604 RepID=UPI0022E2C2B1|nr:uncharacterized protein LOC128243958 [Mya arenaria]